MLKQCFENIVSKYPNNIAIIYKGKKITYSQLKHLVNCCANNICNKFKTINEIGLVADQNEKAIIFIISAIFCGKTIIPLDPRFSVLEIEKILSKLTTHIVVDSYFKNTTKRLIPVKIEELFTDNFNGIEFNKATENNAYILHTTGTTGNPKPVLASSASLYKLISQLINHYYIDSNSLVFQFAYLSFDSAFVEIWCTILSGGTLIIAGKNLRNDFYGTFSKIAKLYPGITITLPPSVAAGINSDILPYIKTLILAGEECPPTLVNNLIDRVEHVINAYGPTEAIICATTYEVKSKQKSRVPIGKPLGGMKIKLCEDGEMCLFSEYLAEGYVGDSDNNSFGADKFKNRYYKTGDLAKKDKHGNFVFIGRNDNQIKINGQKIELEGIEILIRNAFKITQISVVYLETIVPGLYCVLESNKPLMKNCTLTKINSILPSNIKITNIIKIENLPLDRNGKIDRRRIKNIVIQRLLSKKDYIGNITNNCQEIIKLWEEAFGNNIHITPSTEFFKIGGNSLTALKLVSLINKKFYTNLKLADIINNDTPILLKKFLEVNK